MVAEMQVRVALVLLAVSVATGTYIHRRNHHRSHGVHPKSNVINPIQKKYGALFHSDWEIQHYLKWFGTEMMLWRCRNAIQPFWDWKPISVVELYCEAVGVLRKVSWYHNGHKIQLAGKYRQMIYPHYAHGRYFSRWIDFRLKIYNATSADSGVYTFRATSPSGYHEEQYIYVDISEKKRKKKKRKEMKRDKSRPKREHKRVKVSKNPRKTNSTEGDEASPKREHKRIKVSKLRKTNGTEGDEAKPKREHKRIRVSKNRRKTKDTEGDTARPKREHKRIKVSKNLRKTNGTETRGSRPKTKREHKRIRVSKNRRKTKGTETRGSRPKREHKRIRVSKTKGTETSA